MPDVTRSNGVWRGVNVMPRGWKMSRVAPSLLLSVALTALGAGAAGAQSALPPSAAATPTQIYTGASPYSRIAPSTASTGAISPGTDATSSATAQPGNVGPYPSTGFKTDRAIWYPSVTGATFYDDNVFARHTNRLGDWAGVVRPELAWRSYGLENIDVVGSAFVDQRWYDRFHTEDQLNGGAVLGTTVRAGENTQVVTRFAYLHGHEDRGTSDSINTTFLRPLSYDQADGAGAINQRYGRWWTSVGAAASLVRFSTGTIAGVPIPQNYRDGTIATAPFRVGYVVAPLTSVFVEVAPNARDFHVNLFDSQGWRAVGGALFEPGPGSRIKGEIFGGYMVQAYSGFGFQTVSTFTYGSSLAFLLTPQWTAVLEGRRDAREASLSGGVLLGTPGDGVSVVESLVSGRMDYAVLPNLILGAGAAYLQDDYLGAGRSDHAISPLASLKYYPNRYLSLGFDYRYLNFDSTGLGVLGYYRNVYLFSANLKL
jgi:hypothetical protein